jgi:hypothetical protein
VVRHTTRYGGGALGQARGRAASLISLSLPGAAYISELHGSAFAWLQAPEGCLAYRRGPNLVLALNAGDVPVESASSDMAGIAAGDQLSEHDGKAI